MKQKWVAAFLEGVKGRAERPKLSEILAEFCAQIGIAWSNDRDDEPTEYHSYNDFEPHLKEPVALWHSVRLLCFVIEGRDGRRLGVRQNLMRIPLLGFHPARFETFLDGLYCKANGVTSDNEIRLAIQAFRKENPKGFGLAALLPNNFEDMRFKRRVEVEFPFPVTAEWIHRACCESPERRAMLATSAISPGRRLLTFATSPLEPQDRKDGINAALDTTIARMLRIKTDLDGTETFDRTAFFSVLSDLQATRAARKGKS